MALVVHVEDAAREVAVPPEFNQDEIDSFLGMVNRLKKLGKMDGIETKDTCGVRGRASSAIERTESNDALTHLFQ